MNLLRQLIGAQLLRMGSFCIRISRWFSRSIKWSSLRFLGQSKAMRLTALTPFLGSLILLDQHVVTIISNHSQGTGSINELSTFFAKKISGLNVTTLYLLYVGLSFLGFGSIVFALRCPAQIRSAINSTEYISQERPHFSPVLSGSIFSRLSQLYLKSTNPGSWLAKVGHDIYMSQQSIQSFEDLLNQVYQQNPLDIDPESNIVTMMDTLNVDSVAECLRGRRRVHRAIWQTFDNVSDEFRPDVLRLDYEVADASATFSKIVVCILYGIGFLLIFIPTTKTFATISALLVETMLGH